MAQDLGYQDMLSWEASQRWPKGLEEEYSLISFESKIEYMILRLLVNEHGDKRAKHHTLGVSTAEWDGTLIVKSML